MVVGVEELGDPGRQIPMHNSFAGQIFHPLRHLDTHVQKPFLHFILNGTAKEFNYIL